MPKDKPSLTETPVRVKRLPFEVPPFTTKFHFYTARYDWWVWHPLYPYWSRSAWGGDTEHGAREAYDESEGSLGYSAAKLVKEEDGAFTVLDERDPVRLDVWEKISKDMRFKKKLAALRKAEA